MRIHSLFSSINGEVTSLYQGSLCTFIRLAGCNLKCSYCDTPYAQSMDSGKEMDKEEILDQIVKLGNNKITVTGGEPLLQKGIFNVLLPLFYSGYEISIETNGSIPMLPYLATRFKKYPRIRYIADWKSYSSGMRSKMKISNFKNLSPVDFVKFVIKDETDFKDALWVINRLKVEYVHPQYAFSPMFGSLEPNILLKWMQGSVNLKRLGAVLNIQIHKIIDVK